MAALICELSRLPVEFRIGYRLVAKAHSQGKQRSRHGHKARGFRLLGKLFLQVPDITEQVSVTILNPGPDSIVSAIAVHNERPGKQICSKYCLRNLGRTTLA
jgi:hypothetical protein